MYGKFLKDTAGYEINTLNLPTSWEYIYENKDILLKLDQFGPVYAQAQPPGDIMLFQRERHQKYSPWCTWIEFENGEEITNFFRPNKMDADVEPENIRITYRPECATYEFEYQKLQILTEFFIPNEGTTVVCKLKIKNMLNMPQKVKLSSHLVPYLNDAVMAPWDKYEWYLDTKCEQNKRICFESKLMDANACVEKRRKAYFVADKENLCACETSLEKYIGQGDVVHPQRMYSNQRRLYAYPPIYATLHEWMLSAGEERELTQVLSLAGMHELDDWFESDYYLKQKLIRKQKFDTLFAKNHIETGDKEFDYYFNYWVPLQMEWVASLDRGWPTGMRGSRDSAQDYTGILYTDAKVCRNIIVTMLECQRTDGWFPRQYSAKGRHGKHDLREYVDSGVFFVEFMWKYLAHTQDYAILDEYIPWLNSDQESSVLEHVIKAVEYYLVDENIGEHGLCKIREGDWLDSVNRAGLEGRGESVTVSMQLVMALWYLSDILTNVQSETDVTRYQNYYELLKQNINQYAWNNHEFYNSVFTDKGEWVFSDLDPDEKERIYGVVNYYAAISGVADEDKYVHIKNVADKLMCDKGYRLFYPYMGEIPIEKVGRIASGDTPPFMIENGNVYNHGSQGFLARALSVMGEEEKLFETLKWIVPYDMEKHPTEKTFTPPYAIVNCYQQLPGFDHRGLMCFLTGSVAMALRGVYEWFAGLRPCLDGLEIEPCIPTCLHGTVVVFEYLDNSYTMKIDGCDNVFINKKKLIEKRMSFFTRRECYFVSLEHLKDLCGDNL